MSSGWMTLPSACSSTLKECSSAAHLELVWQVLGEPGVRLDASNGDSVSGVAHKDLAHHVQALPGDVQVCGEAVLHTHDPLQQCILCFRCHSTHQERKQQPCLTQCVTADEA